jgi:hypothetical protein
LSSEPDVKVSLHPAPRQLGACHAYLDELGRGSAGATVPDCSLCGFGLGVPVQMVDFHEVFWLEIKSAVMALSVLSFQQFGYLFW